jgi:hypothetical protein
MVDRLLICVAFLAITGRGNAIEPVSASLEQMAQILRGNVRLISIGDSYSAPYWSRIAPAGLRVWPIPHIEGLCNGADGTPAIVRCVSVCEPVSDVMASDANGYSVERELSKTHYFGLPIYGIKEIYTDNDFETDPDGGLFEFKLNVDELDTSVHGSFSSQDDMLRFRLLFRAPSDHLNQPDSFLLQTEQSIITGFDPIDGARKFYHLNQKPDGIGRTSVARQINATAFDIPISYDDSNLYSVKLMEDAPLKGSNRFFDLAGAVYSRTNVDGSPKHGLYFTSIADGSWSYAGYGSDTESTGTHNKKFSLEQFTYWLDVTTLRQEQPIVFLWLFDVEPLTPKLMRSRTEAYIDQADTAASLVGITTTHHLLVTPHMHTISGEISAEHMENHHTICAELATERDNVSFASIYAATDGIMFNGSSESIAWLERNGFNNFAFGTNEINLIEEYAGNFLDQMNVHPNSKNAAAFFSSVLGNIIRDAGCQADIVPDGYINVYDLLALINGWGNSGQGDVNNDSITNIVDLLIVIDGWGDCWPVQAPYNTPAFRSTR